MAFPTTSLLDNFSGTLSNWTNSQFGDGALTIVSGAVQGPDGTHWGGAVWTNAFGPDMESWVNWSALPATTDDTGIWVRCTNSGGSPTGYTLTLQATTGNWWLTRFLAGAGSIGNLASGTQAAAGVGDSFGLQVIGTTVTAYYKVSGGSWVVLTSQTDTNISGTGKIGLEVFGNVQLLDNFGGGTYVPPGYGTPGKIAAVSWISPP
jgi:hypothetical protein